MKIHNCDDKEVANKNTDVYELHKPLTVGVDKMTLKNIILYNNYNYTKKHELGKKIYDFVNKNGIHEESLRSEYKEALELYMK